MNIYDKSDIIHYSGIRILFFLSFTAINSQKIVYNYRTKLKTAKTFDFASGCAHPYSALQLAFSNFIPLLFFQCHFYRRKLSNPGKLFATFTKGIWPLLVLNIIIICLILDIRQASNNLISDIVIGTSLSRIHGPL